jgi:tetratricopeptide (TPR) repeat protein
VVVSADGDAVAVNGEHGEQHVVIIRAGNKTPLRAGWDQDCRFTALSPDSKWLAVGAWHRSDVSLFDASTGTLVHQLTSQSATAVAFSPDGQWLAACDYDAVRFYHVGSWRLSHSYESPGIGYLSFSPDSALLALGKILSGDEPNAVHLVHAATGRLLARLENTPAPTQIEEQLTFSPDGSQLVVPHWRDRVFCKWDLRAIRRRLSSMGLDWDAPPLPEPEPAPTMVLDVEVVDLSSVTALIDRLQFGYEITKRDAQQVDAAIDELSHLHDDSDDATRLVLRGRLNWLLGRDREALQDFSEAIACDAEPIDAYYYRARTHWWAHELPAAIEDYEEVLRRDLDHERALLEGAMCYASCPPGPSHAERGLELAERYFARHGNGTPVRHSQGLAFFRLNRLDESEQAIRRAMNDGVAWLKPHLALAAIYHRRGETAKAREYLETTQWGWQPRTSSQNAKATYQWQLEVEQMLGLPGSGTPPQPHDPLIVDGLALLLSSKATEGRMLLLGTGMPKPATALNWCPAHAGARLTCKVRVTHAGRYRISTSLRRKAEARRCNRPATCPSREYPGYQRSCCRER